jgi:hypothetical protein
MYHGVLPVLFGATTAIRHITAIRHGTETLMLRAHMHVPKEAAASLVAT